MGVYSGQAPEIMSPHQFGGVSAVNDSSIDQSAATPAHATASSDTVRTLATVDQAARKTANS